MPACNNRKLTANDICDMHHMPHLPRPRLRLRCDVRVQRGVSYLAYFCAVIVASVIKWCNNENNDNENGHKMHEKKTNENCQQQQQHGQQMNVILLHFRHCR
ncbi:hypothetical protein ACLKA7_004480 [Drosophila subpalustris]